MPPRRSHKKSRDGCRRCKSRKIKCDEVHPRCGNCTKHGVECDFEHPEAVGANSPGPGPSSTSERSGRPAAATASNHTSHPLGTMALSLNAPVANRLLELRLMHHYISLTSKTLTITAPITEEIWRDSVPQIAFATGSQHLADGILAIAALHLRSLYPHDQAIVRASHGYMASCLREYSNILTRGINAANAESLFLTATLIAIQSTATRVFTKDESVTGSQPDNNMIKNRSAPLGGYSLPLSWFHSFQGVKAITAASWQWLRHSNAVIPIINSQPVLQLDFSSNHPTFFGHLLDGLDEEIAAMASNQPAPSSTGDFGASGAAGGMGANSASAANTAANTPSDFGSQSEPRQPSQGQSEMDVRQATRQAYEHAVAVLNWAHKIPHKGSPLAFPATVSRRFVELIEAREPRALAILACFFALLKCLDSIWWLRGMARREVLGIVSLFNSDLFGPEVESHWWPHLEWSVRVALHDDRANPGYVPPELWGTNWLAAENDEAALAGNAPNFVSHIEMLTEIISGIQSFPAPEPTQSS